MKPTFFTDINTIEYNSVRMCGSIIQLKSKLYTDETHMYLNTKTQYYNNHLHVGSIIPLKSIII
jgi:hypothetical protein